MPWLLEFLDEMTQKSPKALNATLADSEELEVAVVELDEMHSYVKNRKNQQG